MKLRDTYKKLKDENFKCKTYNVLKKHFLLEVVFSKEDATENITQIH